MKLHEIIEMNEKRDTSIIIDEIIKYKKSLLCLFGDDAILMIIDVFNACSYAKIVHSDSFDYMVELYLETMPDLDYKQRDEQKELIYFNSIFLKNL
jgi:hypothetical protein